MHVFEDILKNLLIKTILYKIKQGVYDQKNLLKNEKFRFFNCFCFLIKKKRHFVNFIVFSHHIRLQIFHKKVNK